MRQPLPEQLCRGGHADDALERLEELRSRLREVIDGLAVLQQSAVVAPVVPAESSLDPGQLKNSLARLERLLDSDLRQAGSLLRELRGQAAGASVDQDLAEALHSFDIDEAKSLIAAIGQKKCDRSAPLPDHHPWHWIPASCRDDGG